jgi:hypothetical protein
MAQRFGNWIFFHLRVNKVGGLELELLMICVHDPISISIVSTNNQQMRLLTVLLLHSHECIRWLFVNTELKNAWYKG